jgi:hypothetical protein
MGKFPGLPIEPSLLRPRHWVADVVYFPIAETVTKLLQAVRAHAGIALWQNGEQALANCQRLIDRARHFERRASSFRAFVESVEEEAEHGEVNEAPIVEEGTEGVRVMTVYKAPQTSCATVRWSFTRNFGSAVASRNGPLNIDARRCTRTVNRPSAPRPAGCRARR